MRAARTIAILSATMLLGTTRTLRAGDDDQVGVNVLLDTAATDDLLDALGEHGKVLDVIPQIRAVTLKAKQSEISSIANLAHVVSATEDVECELADAGALPVSDLSGGASHWGLDAIHVTDYGAGRTVDYDGSGVYVAVVDTGLQQDWRVYFPEERID